MPCLPFYKCKEREWRPNFTGGMLKESVWPRDILVVILAKYHQTCFPSQPGSVHMAERMVGRSSRQSWDLFLGFSEREMCPLPIALSIPKKELWLASLGHMFTQLQMLAKLCEVRDSQLQNGNLSLWYQRIKGILAERNNPCSLQVASLITKYYTVFPLLSKLTHGPPGCLDFLCENDYVITNGFFIVLSAPLAFVLYIQAHILFDTIILGECSSYVISGPVALAFHMGLVDLGLLRRPFQPYCVSNGRGGT